MAIFEEHMDLVDIENIKITKRLKNSIHFNDGIHDYNFSLSKNTLFKRFDTTEPKKIFGFEVNILEDPFDFLLSLKADKETGVIELTHEDSQVSDYIVLPLYSPITEEVQLKSGLNQWNAGGRARDENEVYIPIPAWIHRAKTGFFTYNTDDNKTGPFDVKLPNGKFLSMKVAQQGGKALMSNPNNALGKWILRDILELRPKEIVTKEQLDLIGIDSVKLSKLENGTYALDFLKSGSFDEFEENYNN